MIFLGIDVGSTGSKCVAFLDTGEELASHYLEYPKSSGETDLDPCVLMESVFEVISGCVGKVSNPEDIASITVSSFGESFVPLDVNGDPVSDIIMYYADRARGELVELVSKVGSERIMEITRTLPDTMYSAPKMMWTLRNSEKQVDKFLLIAGYICYKLSEEMVTDYSLAARTLLFDPIKLDWSSELLEASGVSREQLPLVVPTGTVAGSVLPDVARELGLPLGVKILIGAHDQVVTALGAGVLRPGDSVDGTGTVECITPLFTEIPSNLSFIKKNYVTIPYLSPGSYVTYAFNFSGGSLVKWYRDTLANYLKADAAEAGVSVYDLLNQMCPAESSDLLIVPHFQGAGGTPDMVKSAKGMMYGFTMETGLPDIYRAILEGLTFEMAYNLEMLNEFDIVPERMFATGGGARSSIWLQIKADILGTEVIPLQSEEAGALGGAILAAKALGMFDSIESAAKHFVKYQDPVVPNLEYAEHYRNKYSEFKDLRKYALSKAITV